MYIELYISYYNGKLRIAKSLLSKIEMQHPLPDVRSVPAYAIACQGRLTGPRQLEKQVFQIILALTLRLEWLVSRSYKFQAWLIMCAMADSKSDSTVRERKRQSQYLIKLFRLWSLPPAQSPYESHVVVLLLFQYVSPGKADIPFLFHTI